MASFVPPSLTLLMGNLQRIRHEGKLQRAAVAALMRSSSALSSLCWRRECQLEMMSMNDNSGSELHGRLGSACGTT